jgi:hybrid cluster-associated redox disulfide protein
MVKIDPDILVADFAEMYPEAVNFLITEYGFHCVGCYVSSFETLREGAAVHGIMGDDFEEMIKSTEQLIADGKEKKKPVKKVQTKSD